MFLFKLTPTSHPPGRRGRPNFAAQLEATREFVGFGDEDEVYIESSKEFIAARLDDVIEQIGRELRARSATAALFADTGDMDRERGGLRRDTLRRWLTSIVDAPLNAATAEYLAAIGHANVRPRDRANRIKARYLVTTICRLQVLFIELLAEAISDPVELGHCVAACCKRLTVHLDALLSVYAAAEATPHWY